MRKGYKYFSYISKDYLKFWTSPNSYRIRSKDKLRNLVQVNSAFSIILKNLDVR